MQVVRSYKEISVKILSHLKSSYQNTKKELYSKVVNVIQRTSKPKIKLYKCIRIEKVIFGSLFFGPLQIFSKPQEEKTVNVEFPKKKERKKIGKWLKMLLSVYEVLSLILRTFRLVMTFGPVLALYPLTYLGKTATDVWWKLLLAAIEMSGPILLKLGQWASTRRDIFPDSCCSQFSRLQRRVKPHSWKYTVTQMKKAFGPNWRKIFVKFDNDCNPIGSGCIAQVYKVWMCSEAIHDSEILEEILSEMDDDSPSIDEGFEVLGFGRFFSSEKFLALEQAVAWKEWRERQELRRNQEREEKLKEELLTRQFQAGSEASHGEEINETPEEANLLSIAENLANDVLNIDEQAPVDSDVLEDVEREAAEDVPPHSLVEEWQESGLDKSLPMDEAPPEDLDGLVPVAIKILHPGVQSAFGRDLQIMKACAWFITFIFPPIKWLSLPQCVDEFAEVMAAQINLVTEAENLETFSENFSEVPFIRFPRPLRPYVTKKVLVETYEDGQPMIDIIRSTETETSEELKKRLAEIGVDALLKMVFVDNLVHGDLHPGNMLVQNNNLGQDGDTCSTRDNLRIMMVDVGCDTFVMDVQPDPNPLRICLLDCGIVSKLSEQNLANIKAVFKQVVLGDGDSVAELFLDKSDHQCQNPEAFKAEITELVQTARENTISLGQVDVGSLLQQVLSILLRHHVRLESAFSAVVLAIFVLEGLGRTLDPDMDILERARPILVRGEIF